MSDFLKAKSIDHVNMRVKNLEQSVEFYKNLFGFEIKQEETPNKLDAPSKIIGNDAIKLCLYEDPPNVTRRRNCSLWIQCCKF
jgi:lactoylglutathione lyase